MASYEKNIKRNKTRPKVAQRGLVQSLQRSYYRPKEKLPELTKPLW